MFVRFSLLILTLSTLLAGQEAKPVPSSSVEQDAKAIPSGSKIFVASMDNNFQEALKAALARKKVPVRIVDSKEAADFEVSGTSETQKAGAAKIILMGNWHSREEASIRVTNLQSGVVAFAYSYHNDASAHGKQSAAEACAKHLKEKIEKQ
jgi:hypothetical protein